MSDWPEQAADTVVSTVDKVRDKATGPALTVSRAIVYGVLILVFAVAALILFVIGAVRFGSYWLPVWAVYLILGVLFVLAGIILYRQRAPKVAAVPEPAGNQAKRSRG
jgi:hypothetical protein